MIFKALCTAYSDANRIELFKTAKNHKNMHVKYKKCTLLFARKYFTINLCTITKAIKTLVLHKKQNIRVTGCIAKYEYWVWDYCITEKGAHSGVIQSLCEDIVHHSAEQEGL